MAFNMALSLTDLESKDLTVVSDLGQDQLGSKDNVTPLSFIDFDKDVNPREIRTTVKVTSLLGKTDTIGQSAVNKAKVAYRAMNMKDRAVLRGMLDVDAEGAVEVMAESFAHEHVRDVLKPKSSFRQDKKALKIGYMRLEYVSVNGVAGDAAAATLMLPDVKRSGFFGLV